MSPQRIQRRRTKGWRMPAGAIYVGRPSAWGNVWRVGDRGWRVFPGGRIDRGVHEPMTAEDAVASYRNALEADPDMIEIVRKALGGRDLACWCPPGVPCHADVLLELANPPEAGVR